MFETIEESLQRGDLQNCEYLIQSIEFREFRTAEAALIFYTARLFADTNQFNNTPTYEQERRAQALFQAPVPTPQQTVQQPLEDNIMNNANIQQLLNGILGNNGTLTQALDNMFGQNGHFTNAIANLNPPAVQARELSLVKIDSFRGSEDEDSYEWIELFNHIVIANN